MSFSPRFKRAYKKLPLAIKEDFDEKISLFIENPTDPRLRAHSLHGKLQECRSFSLRQGYRVLFEFADAQAVNLLDVGVHDRYGQWKK